MKPILNLRCRETGWMAVGLAMTLNAAAQGKVSTNFFVGVGIPDNNISGLANSVTLASLPIDSITNLEVTLNISGGYNGDYYAYLTHGAGFAVLLNRVGRDVGNPFGYPDSGLNVTFNDSAAKGDVHTYRLVDNPGGLALTGSWSPDARADDPADVTTTSPRTAFLSSFTGFDPNGDWTLFVADLDPGSSGTLTSWGLVISGVVPEPGTGLLILLGGLGLTLCSRARRR